MDCPNKSGNDGNRKGNPVRLSIGEISFLDYLSATHRNLLVNFVNFSLVHELHQELEELYIALLHCKYPNGELMIKLFLHHVHEQFYFSHKCILEGSVFNAANSVRRAFEATFCAYILFEENLPDGFEAYIEGAAIKNKKHSGELLNEQEQRLLSVYNKKFYRPLDYIKDNKGSFPLAFPFISAIKGIYHPLSHIDPIAFTYNTKFDHPEHGAVYTMTSMPEDRTSYKLQILNNLYLFSGMQQIFGKYFMDRNLLEDREKWMEKHMQTRETLEYKIMNPDEK